MLSYLKWIRIRVRFKIRVRVKDMVRVGKVFRVMGFIYVSIQWGRGVTGGNLPNRCMLNFILGYKHLHYILTTYTNCT